MKIKCALCMLDFEYIAFCGTCDPPSVCDDCTMKVNSSNKNKKPKIETKNLKDKIKDPHKKMVKNIVLYMIQIGDDEVTFIFQNYDRAVKKAQELIIIDPMMVDAVYVDKDDWDYWKTDDNYLDCWAQESDIKNGTLRCHRMYIRQMQTSD